MALYFTYGPSAVDSLLSTTLSVYRKTMVDNIYTALPTFNYLYKAGRKETLDGGASIIVPVMYAKNSTAGFYSGSDPLDVTPQEPFTSGQFKWKQLAASVVITGFEEAVNRGKHAVLNLLKERTRHTEMSIADKLGNALFAAAPGTNDITSLATLVDATSTIGDINSTTYSWWQSTVTSSGSFSAQGLADMRTLYNTLSKYTANDYPDFGVTTQSVLEYYENLAVPHERIIDTTTADLGFEAMKFKGMKLFFDENATSGVLYMLNSKHMKLVVHSDRDFSTSPFVRPENQDVRVAQILWMGNLVTDERRKLGKLTGITA